MSRRNGTKALFAGRHFDREVILLCVRWYLRYKLSLRDLVEMMAERGLHLAHTTIMRWVQPRRASWNGSSGRAFHRILLKRTLSNRQTRSYSQNRFLFGGQAV